MSLRIAAVTLACVSIVFSLPIRREVPQGETFICLEYSNPIDIIVTNIEHSHESFLTSVRASLNLNNPDGIVDPVFGLLGNAAAAGGAGKIAVSRSRRRSHRIPILTL